MPACFDPRPCVRGDAAVIVIGCGPDETTNNVEPLSVIGAVETVRGPVNNAGGIPKGSWVRALTA